MSNSYFRFKQFTIYQDNCAMKVGTDGALLGAWCLFPHNGNILDVGCGTGLITLMAAQRSLATVDGVEIDPVACKQAQENVILTPWANRIKLYAKDFQEFSENNSVKYDYIVSNPPFFKDSLLPPSSNRSNARHTISLNYETLFSKSSGLLKSNGKIAIIFPSELENHVLSTALSHKLYLTRITRVKGHSKRPVKRILAEWGKELTEYESSELNIELEPGIYSPEFISLLQDFYLKF